MLYQESHVHIPHYSVYFVASGLSGFMRRGVDSVSVVAVAMPCIVNCMLCLSSVRLGYGFLVL